MIWKTTLPCCLCSWFAGLLIMAGYWFIDHLLEITSSEELFWMFVKAIFLPLGCLWFSLTILTGWSAYHELRLYYGGPNRLGRP